MRQLSSEQKRRARESLTGHFGLAMSAFLTVNLLVFLLNIPFQPSTENPDRFQMLIFFLSSFIISLLSVVLNSGILYIHLQFARKKDARPADVFRFFGERPDRFLLTGLFLTLLYIIAALPAIGCGILAFYTETIAAWLLFAAVLILTAVLECFVGLTFDLIYFLLIDRPDERVPALLKECKKLMNGHKLQKLYIDLSFLGLYFIAILSLGIGLLWVIPYKTQTYTEFYRTIIQEA